MIEVLDGQVQYLVTEGALPTCSYHDRTQMVRRQETSPLRVPRHPQTRYVTLPPWTSGA